MSLWRQLARGVRNLVDRRAADEEVVDEVQDYLDRATAESLARGASPEDARRNARAEIGNMTVAREQIRAYGWENTLEAVVADLRHAARQLRTNIGFTVVSVLTLALGIGASAAIFSVVNPILFEPLPYPDAGSITTITDVAADGQPLDVAFGTYRELVQRSHSFAALAVLKAWQPTLLSVDRPERLSGQRVSADYLRVLGVSPVRGRNFTAVDDQLNGPNVVVISDGLWRRRFGADPAIVGRSVTLDGGAFTVIGVMPITFENALAPSTELWAPLQYSTSLDPDGREWGHHLRMVGRLRHGVDASAAKRELDAIARAPIAELPRVPWASLSSGMHVGSLQADVTRAVRPALLAVSGAVLLVLAIAGVNVANLLLARGARRRGEFAMRAALGAGRGRLMGQMLTESVLLAIIGGVLGLIVATIGVRALIALSPPELPRLAAISVDRSVFAFALAITTAVGLVVGMMPALQASRADLDGRVRQASRRAAGDHHRIRGALVMAEVALALVLLVGAGLLLRSVERLLAVPVGFDPSRVLTLQVQFSGQRFTSDAVRYQFFDRALQMVRAVPGVAAAAFTSQLPLSGDFDGYGVHFATDRDPRQTNSALRYAITPGYLEALRIPLRYGRVLDARDAADAPRAVLLNESLARRKFGGERAIGQRLKFGPDDGAWYTVVGVVGDVKQASLATGDADAVYITEPQWHWVDNVMSLVVRGQGDVTALLPAVREAIWSVDKEQPIVRIATMDELVALSVADRRFALVLFETFAIVALALAAVGIYGVLSSKVAERTREIGVRSALGASRRSILALIVGQGMQVTAVGAGVGLAAAALASRALTTLLFGVSRLDPVTYAGVVVLLAAVSALACAIPAWRAARVDPAITLRCE